MKPIYAAVMSILVTVGAVNLGHAQNPSQSLYMVQKPFESRGDIQVGYGYGFMNPYENLHHVVLKGNYRLNTNWQVGLQGSYISPIKNDATRALENSLGNVQIRTEFQNPQYSIHGTVGMIPLSGLLNFFGSKVVPFDLVLGLKGGITEYKRSGTAPSFGPFLEYKTYFFNRLGVYFGIEYSAEYLKGVNSEPAVWVSQSHVAGGMTWAF